MKYTAEEVREWAAFAQAQGKLYVSMKGAHEPWEKLGAMLTDYAERIEADESAVPVGVVRTDGCMKYASIPLNIPDGTKIYLHPPAQAAQVESDAGMAKQVLAWMTRTGSLSTTWGDMAALSQSAAEPVAQHPDDAAVDAFAMAMKAKLAEARAKGRGGWQDKADCPQQRLSDMLHAHVAKGDPRDVANFCMFLHQRGESILPAEPVARVDQVGELLAVIHGDGGHYRAEHGLQKAAKDAQEKVIQMMTKIAAAEPAQSVDVAKVREVIAEILRCAGNNNAKFHLTWADKLETAIKGEG